MLTRTESFLSVFYWPTFTVLSPGCSAEALIGCRPSPRPWLLSPPSAPSSPAKGHLRSHTDPCPSAASHLPLASEQVQLCSGDGGPPRRPLHCWTCPRETGLRQTQRPCASLERPCFRKCRPQCLGGFLTPRAAREAAEWQLCPQSTHALLGQTEKGPGEAGLAVGTQRGGLPPPDRR